MDLRLLVIGLTFLLFVVAFVFFIAAVRSSRRARARAADEARAGGDVRATGAAARPLGEILREPIRTGEWPPRDVHPPDAAAGDVVDVEELPASVRNAAATESSSTPTAPRAFEPPRPPVTVRTVDPPPTPAEHDWHYQLVAPVELRIQGIRKRIGVRTGTATHDEFQRAAEILLAELRRSRDPQG